VYNEGVRVYVDTTTTKGLRGGFAIGGFSMVKGAGQEYLRVTPDSVRIYINDADRKGPRRGGFAIGGYGTGKGPSKKFLDLTSDNYFIGHESGKSNISGAYNIFLGYRSGISNTEGCFNTFIGYQSGFNNIGYDTAIAVLLHGSNNTFIGYKAGYYNTMGDYNTFIGTRAGMSNTQGRQNIFVGYNTGDHNTTGSFNLFMGNFAGRKNVDGRNNTFLGNSAGVGNVSGERNIFIGGATGDIFFSGDGNTVVGEGAASGISTAGGDGTGENNVYIVRDCAKFNKDGSLNVFIGYQAGYNEQGSKRLYISNSSTSTPLIYGEFDTPMVQINGDLYYTGNLGQPSDIRLKRDLRPIAGALAKIEKLSGYYFYWRDDARRKKGLPEERQIGLVAQEMEKYFPEAVTRDRKGYLYLIIPR